MTIYDEHGKPKVAPSSTPVDVWTTLPHNPKVEVNQKGIYRTKDMTPEPVVKPLDEYYGYGEWC